MREGRRGHAREVQLRRGEGDVNEGGREERERGGEVRECIRGKREFQSSM